MKSLICCTFLFVSLCSVQGRSYGYHKNTKHTTVVKPKDHGFLKDPIHIPNDHGFVKDPVHIPNDHAVLPSNKLLQCNKPCTLQIIPPQCVQETIEFEHGVRCRGCDIDICSGRGDSLDRWQGGSQWQDGSFQNRNQRIGGGFVDSLGNDFLNVLGQNSNLDGRIGNRFDTNLDRRNRFDTNNDRNNRFDTNIGRRTNIDRNNRFDQIFNERRSRLDTNRQVGNGWL
ncbi:uncharacterized protein LOC134684986 isoform X2 [Mytilus trossulus]|uniref:uncharacterized protein LOC134684986 isoform X2 n=1 Tax=Mytilus trossulus TaxID=6551 RepID=UPI003005AD10